MASKPKTGPLCVVSIGYRKVLLPASVGMKVVALLANAVELEWDHDASEPDQYIVGEPLDVSYKSVQPAKLRVRPDLSAVAPRKPLLLEGR